MEPTMTWLHATLAERGDHYRPALRRVPRAGPTGLRRALGRRLVAIGTALAGEPVRTSVVPAPR